MNQLQRKAVPTICLRAQSGRTGASLSRASILTFFRAGASCAGAFLLTFFWAVDVDGHFFFVVLTFFNLKGIAGSG